jgi:hypothetical protein
MDAQTRVGKMAVIVGRHPVQAAHAGAAAMPQTFTVGSRSWFVNTAAWLIIGLAAVLAVAALSAWGLGTGAPHPWLLAVTFTAVPAAVSAVGLLQRLDWARRLFIGMLSLTAAVGVAGLWWQLGALAAALRAAQPAGDTAALWQRLLATDTSAGVLAALITLALAAVCVWVVRRLRSPMVRQEFA